MFQHKPVLLFACLLALVACIPATTLAQDVRLGHDVVPTFQTIDLELDASGETYAGSVGFELMVQKATETFRLHAEDMNLESVTLRKDGEMVEITHEVDDDGVLTVKAKDTLKPGKALLGITFNDDYNTDAVGLYRMEYEGTGYLFTQFEADDAREAIPCWDEPIFKIPFQMTLTVPEGDLAITNTPIEKEVVLEDGRRRITFQKTKPLPTYLLAIAAGPLETVEIPGLGVPGRVVTVKGQSHLAGHAVEVTPPILKALEDYFGGKYPYEKCDLIAVPEYWPGAMENPGAITYSDGILLLDPGSASLSQKRRLVRVTAHELAHMWFGDMVTMEWWDDLWLNESFADWMGDKIADEVFPSYKQRLSTTADGQQIMIQDARPSTVPIRRPILSTDNLMENVGLAYSKGKAVLAMFEQWLGPEDFRKGVLSYIEENAWGNATAQDLWKHLDRASGKSLSEALAGFIEQPGFPMITVEVQGATATITQQRFHNYGATVEPMTWKVPVGLRYSVGGRVETKTVLLEKAAMTVDLGADPEWIHPNHRALGYYRWSVPGPMMAVLAGNAQGTMSAAERIEFLYNQIGLLMAGALGGDDILRGLAAFATDREPLVLATVLEGLEGIKEPLVPEESEEAFAVYLRRTLGPAMEWCGFEARPDEDETMAIIRPRLIAILGDEGRDPEVRAFAAKQARAYLDDPASVDPALAGVVLRLAAHQGDRALFDAYRVRAEEAKTPTERTRFLGTLGSFRTPELREAALTYALSEKLRPQEMFMVSRGVGSNREGQDRLFRWMTENYEAILSRIPPVYAAYMPYFAGGCSEERLAAAQEFFAMPDHQGPGTDKQLEKVTDQVSDCVALREREGEAVSRYLSRLQEESGED